MGRALTGGWRVAAGSVAGASHLRQAIACQDAHAWTVLPGGALAAAVADGAGSAPGAAAGAVIAVRAALEALVALAAPGARGADAATAVRPALERARSAVELAAVDAGAPAADFACTLIVCIATHAAVHWAQVGDGTVIVRDATGRLHAPATTTRSGEYLNETIFLTSPSALDALTLSSWEGDWSHLAILTDGLQMLALTMPSGQPHGPFFEPLFRFVSAESDPAVASERLRGFLAGPRIAARADDDLTLVLAARPQGMASP